MLTLTAPAQVTQTLIVSNALWKYVDDGSDLGTAWTAPTYDDDFWREGPAELGYGDAEEGRPEATVIRFGPDPNNKYITTYFRHAFDFTNAAAVTNLTVRLLRDDGAVVYVNGMEVVRSAMPEGPIAHNTLAAGLGAIGLEESTFFEFAIPPESLVNGRNVVAVEVHQRFVNSSDVSFALELVARAPPVVVPEAALVRGPYLQSGTKTNIVVRWRTDQLATSRVRYGTNPANLNLSVTDSDLSLDHSVLLPNLQPDTKYFYAIDTAVTNLVGGPDFFFVTAPRASKPTRIWAIGDFGTTGYPGGRDGAERVRDAYYQFTGSCHTDVWLMLGDNAYGVGTDAEYQRAVFNVYQRLLQQTVAWSTIGNHETYASNRLTGRIAYYDIFAHTPFGQAGGVPSGTINYYSFNYANIHFVCLDSEFSDQSPEGPMATWLQQDLAANTQTWIIAFWHSPPYTKGSHDSDSTFDTDGHLVRMRENFLPILEAHGVDLILSGHSHNYERSYLLHGHYGFSTSLTPSMMKDAGSGQPGDTGAYRKPASGPHANQGAVYAVVGSSGWATFQVGRHPVMHCALLRLGSLVVDVDGNRMDAKFLRETGEIDDQFTILKGVEPDAFRVAVFRKTRRNLFQDDETLVRWKSVAGHVYRVERCTSMENPRWEDISGRITATGATTTWSTDEPEVADKSFYRVVRSSE